MVKRLPKLALAVATVLVVAVLVGVFVVDGERKGKPSTEAAATQAAARSSSGGGSTLLIDAPPANGSIAPSSLQVSVKPVNISSASDAFSNHLTASDKPRGKEDKQATALPTPQLDSLLQSLGSGDGLLASILMGTAVSDNPDTCTAADFEQLVDAVQYKECRTVLLTSRGPYNFTEEVNVTRSVSIVGSPVLMPKLEAKEAIRGFHVLKGGFLELKFVRITIGSGELRERLSPPSRNLQTDGIPMPGQYYVELRGGSVCTEPGALGASFVGVIFLNDAMTLEAVTSAIGATLARVGFRTYGGHVFVAGGTLTFTGCTFYSLALSTPLVDIVFVGGIVLVLDGEVYITGCTIFDITLFQAVMGLGQQLAVLGGLAVISNVATQAYSIATSAVGVGAMIFVGGGVGILTGVVVYFASGLFHYTGIGTTFVAGGVMINSGIAVRTDFGATISTGGGFYVGVGAGVMVQSGGAYNGAVGLGFANTLGGHTFQGTGVSINTGIGQHSSTGISSAQVMGGFGFNGAGYSQWIGCPQSNIAGIDSFVGLGGQWFTGAGLYVGLFNPTFAVRGVGFSVNLANLAYVGAGGALVGFNIVAGLGGIAYDIPEFPARGLYWVNGDTSATAGMFLDLGGQLVDWVPRRRLGLGSNSTSPSWHLNASSSGMGLIAAKDITNYMDANLSDPAVIESLKWVNPAVLAAARQLQSSLGLATKEPMPTLYINSTKPLQCSYCNVGPVAGPGAGQCTADESCQATPHQDGFSWGDIEFKSTMLTLSRLTLEREGADLGPINDTAVRDAVRASLVDRGVSGVHVSAFPTELPASVQAILTGAPLQAVEHLTSATYSVVLVTDNADRAADARAIFKDENVGQWNRQVAGALSDFGVRSASWSHSDVMTIPAYNSADLRQTYLPETASKAAGSNAIRVMDTFSGVAVATLSHKQAYNVVLENFPPGVALGVQLIGSEMKAGDVLQTSRMIQPAASTDKEGRAQFSWAVPAYVTPGEYYIKAADGDGTVFGWSQTIIVVDRPHRRKLYGPLMYM